MTDDEDFYTLYSRPVDSGFGNWRPASEARLSREAQQRVDDKIANVQEARRRAIESWHHYVIGGSP